MNVPYGFGSFDRVAFKLINQAWTHPSLDALMPVLTDLHKVPWFLYGAVPLALGFWLWKERAKAARVLVVAAIAIGVCDLLAYRIIKPWAARERPGHAGIGAIVRAPVGGRYGFPSNHAINAGAAAAVLSVAYPPARFAFWTVAGVVAWSRVYVGAHYPFDVLAGLCLGGVLSWLWALLMLQGRGGESRARKSAKRK